MPMHRNIAIRMLGGTRRTAAKHLGCSPKTISNWPVDEHGNIASREVVDRVLAAAVRKRVHDMAALGITEDASGLNLQELLA